MAVPLYTIELEVGPVLPQVIPQQEAWTWSPELVQNVNSINKAVQIGQQPYTSYERKTIGPLSVHVIANLQV